MARLRIIRTLSPQPVTGDPIARGPRMQNERRPERERTIPYWCIMLSSSVVRLTFGIALTVLLTTLPAAAAQPRPGTYTDYPFDQAGLPNTFTRYDMFVTWESAPLRGAIYPAFTFGFEGGGGYMGTQLDGIDHRILFSIWDSPGGASVVPGPGCSRFGGEGTGGHCGAHYPWVEGREYRLRVLKTGTSADGDDWTGSIADTVTGVETAVGTLHVLNTAPYHGYGQLKKGASTFTEYFGGPEGCDSQPHARIRWRGPYADPSMWLPSAAIVSENVGYPCLTHNNQTSPGAPVVEVETGGAGTPVTNPQGANL